MGVGNELLAPRIHPPPGEIVAVGDGWVHAIVRGRDRPGPAVVLEAGFGCYSLHWWEVIEGVSAFAPVVAYDRRGYGWSSRLGNVPSASARLADLEGLLAGLGFEPPYVLAGHSLGGALVQYYAVHLRDRIGGLVIVDSGVGLDPDHLEAWREDGTELIELLSPPRRRRFFPDPAAPGSALAWFGFTRLLYAAYDTGPAVLPQAYIRANRALHSRRSVLVAAEAERRESAGILAEAYAPMLAWPHDLSGVPLICLAAERGVEDQDLDRRISDYVMFLYRAMARRSVRGELRIISDTGHHIQVDQPDAVIAAIRDVLTRIDTSPASP